MIVTMLYRSTLAMACFLIIVGAFTCADFANTFGARGVLRMLGLE